VNSPAADPAQVGGGYPEPFLRQYVQRGLAILGADGGPAGIHPADWENIGAAEQFNLHILPASPQRIKLFGQVANAEIDIAVPFGDAKVGWPRDRTSRQNAMAQCAGAHARVPEGHSYAGSQNRS